MWRALISAPYLQPVIDRYRPRLAEHGIEVVLPETRERLSENELLSCISDIDGAICGDDRFSETVLKSAGKLKVIVKWGTGIDSIDVAAAERRGIRVCNTPGAFTDPVADTVLGYILAFARQLYGMDRDIREGTWRKRLSVTLGECTLGVVGVGAVGKAVLRRAAAFGMKLIGNDIVPVDPAFLSSIGVMMKPLDDLLADADFVSLNCTLNSTSFHLIGDRQLSRMKPSSFLINTSRGPVVDETALVRALESRRIAGAALDVFEEEPLPADSPLRRLDTCLLAPHNANAGPAAWDRVHENSIRLLIEHLNGQGR